MAKAKSTGGAFGPFTLSFPNLFKPKAMEDGGKLKYSCKLVFKKSNTKLFEELKKAMTSCAKANQEVFKGKTIGGPGFKWAIRDADLEMKQGKEHGPELKGCYFINATSETAPGVVNRAKKPIIDPNEVYAGCEVYASINFFAYNQKGNYGVSAGLNNVLKYADGERLSGKPSAESDFADLEFEEEDITIGEDDDVSFDLGGEDEEDEEYDFSA